MDKRIFFVIILGSLLFFSGCSSLNSETYGLIDVVVSEKIIDNETSLNKTWSSSKIQTELNNINLTTYVNSSGLTQNYIPIANSNNSLKNPVNFGIYNNDTCIVIGNLSYINQC